MIRKSYCKINLGLKVLRKRSDGFHDISTIMYPIFQKPDIVEVIKGDGQVFENSGIVVDCSDDKNLCVKAIRLIQSRYNVDSARIYLHKQIPFGAGLGGGSANAVTVLGLVNEEFELGLQTNDLVSLAAELGSDTPFFVHNTSMLASSRGEILTPITVDLSQYYIYIVKPDFGVSTAMAYSGITPHDDGTNLIDLIKEPIEKWRETIFNDFEKSLFHQLPQLSAIKESLYDSGALYASLSGSGSAVYGIFKEPANQQIDNLWHIEKPI